MAEYVQLRESEVTPVRVSSPLQVNPTEAQLIEEQKASFYKEWRWQAFKACAYICGWYVTSLCLSLYNKWLFSKAHYNFPFPLLTTTFHCIIQFALSLIVVQFIIPSFKPKGLPSVKDYFTKVLPCGLATGLDIGLSNSSLKNITLTFYTMVKSGAPVFVLFFAFLFKLEKPTWRLFLIMLIICFGVLLMVSDKTNFHLTGYIEVQIATILAGLRWALTQILLKKETLHMTNPVATNLFLTPLMAVTLFFSFVIVEGITNLRNSGFFETFSSGMAVVGFISLGGFISFSMMLIEFQLIKTTSVLTFSIAGIIKEILTITISSMIFGDTFTHTAGIGLFISITGICFYNYCRFKSLYKTHQEAHHQLETVHRLSEDSLRLSDSDEEAVKIDDQH